jgi:hypothetical protein
MIVLVEFCAERKWVDALLPVGCLVVQIYYRQRESVALVALSTITIFICFLGHGCYISSIRWQQKEFILQSFG